MTGANESEYDREAPPLDWDSRMKISVGVAKGIAHIHSLDGGTYVHGNIRSSNVLVTNDHQSCISDLSLIYSLSNSFKQFRYTGYQEVDHFFRPKKIVKLTQKHDVYCFGVLLFEMLSRSLPPARTYSDVIDGIPVFLDEAINGNRDAWKMIKLAEKCTSQETNDRPSMDEVVREMEEILVNPVKV
ncbi:hypothetical protein PIB30_037095 [Stylosanthes scabra]|uniref:Protein kinase domain-containing protein n=1 Tax=Stylosanthes scabra TaxID=79078 RepID=A0ABU6RFK0_9FABA|nr:hypothetical protein [Stylosanthes scabra]